MSEVTNDTGDVHSYEQNDESVHPLYLDQAMQKRIMQSICLPLYGVNHKH